MNYGFLKMKKKIRKLRILSNNKYRWLNLENLIYYINYLVETEVMAKWQNEANDKRKKKTTSVSSAQVARARERKKSS